MRLLSLPLIFIAWTQASTAETLADCDALRGLVMQARAGFVGVPEPLVGAERCFMATSLTGGDSYHCAWGFAFRDGAARAAFLATVAQIETCFPIATTAALDQTVNHPDSYDLRQYDLDGIALSASLKDKGALNRTYVFLGVTERAE